MAKCKFVPIVCAIFLLLIEISDGSATPEIYDSMQKLFARNQVELNPQQTQEELDRAIKLLSQQTDHDSWSRLNTCKALVSLGFPREEKCFDKLLIESFDVNLEKLVKLCGRNSAEEANSSNKSNTIKYIKHYREQQLELCSKMFKVMVDEGVAKLSQEHQKHLNALRVALEENIKRPEEVERIAHSCADLLVGIYRREFKLLGNRAYQKSYLKLISPDGQKSFKRDFNLFVRQPCAELVANLEFARRIHELLSESAGNQKLSFDEDTKSWLLALETCSLLTKSNEFEHRVYEEQSNRLQRDSLVG